MTASIKSHLDFTCGVIAAIGFTMAVQDWYGLDSYIEHVRAGWVQMPWFVGAIIGIVASGVPSLVKSGKRTP
jgi:hypothetical protein